MLTSKLETDIDEKWEACWPVSQIKPLAFFDLLSYLFFIKKIGESALLQMATKHFSDDPIGGRLPGEMMWNRFKEMDAQSMYHLFIRPGGLVDFVKSYSQQNGTYSQFVKEPLLLQPTAGLLANTVEIIKILEREDPTTAGKLFDYLLNKAVIIGQNGHTCAPRYIVELLVSLVKPAADDRILDPVTGDGSFLIACSTYIAANIRGENKDAKGAFVPHRFKGIDSDPVQLRIAAMNMLVHGIEEPPLEKLNLFAKTGINLPELPTLILSNLIFKQPETGFTNAADNFKKEVYTANEIELVNIILNNLEKGGRAAVIVPAILLTDNRPAAAKLRQRLVDVYNLEAVITLPTRADSPFSGAGILFFVNPISGVTDKTWFYKMRHPDNSPDEGSGDIQHEEVLKVLQWWKNKEEITSLNTTNAQGYFAEVSEIKNSNYNLSYNQYRKISSEHDAPRKVTTEKNSGVVAVDKPAAPAQYPVTEENPFLQDRPPKKRVSLILLLVFIIAGAVALYLVYMKNPGNKAMSRGNTVIQPNDTSGTFRQDTSFQNNKGADSILLNDKAAIPLKNSSNNAVNGTYTVIAKAYFHDKPDERTRRKAFINHWNKAVLRPLDEINGFIYIVYTNHLGQTSKGWLNKKDLRPL